MWMPRFLNPIGEYGEGWYVCDKPLLGVLTVGVFFTLYTSTLPINANVTITKKITWTWSVLYQFLCEMYHIAQAEVSTKHMSNGDLMQIEKYKWR
jgi:hypothetical protein